MHLIFYDSKCSFCDRSVQLILRYDTSKSFYFAPLQGKTAPKVLKSFENQLKSEGIEDVYNSNSLLFIENYNASNQRLLTRGKAVLRISWYMKRYFCLLGCFSFIPLFPWVADQAYRLFSKHRHKLISSLTNCVVINKKDQDYFLP
jgi:predicted DCC family thiol-disulfide oxidoreductase YuxK